MIERMLWMVVLCIVFYLSGWMYSGKIETSCARDSEIALMNDATIQCNVRVASKNPVL